MTRKVEFCLSGFSQHSVLIFISVSVLSIGTLRGSCSYLRSTLYLSRSEPSIIWKDTLKNSEWTLCLAPVFLLLLPKSKWLFANKDWYLRKLSCFVSLLWNLVSLSFAYFCCQLKFLKPAASECGSAAWLQFTQELNHVRVLNTFACSCCLSQFSVTEWTQDGRHVYVSERF